MNPFAGFLQPPTQRSPLQGVGEFVNQLSQLGLQRQQLAQNKVQHADSSARDWKRIGLQEQVQNRNFSEMDKKEVEGLLAEYQDAEDQGDPVRLDRATQLLKRYGLDVAPGKDPRAFTGTLPGQFLPSTPRQPEVTESPEELERQFIARGETAEPAAPETAEPDIAGHLRSVGPLKALKLNTPEQQEAEASKAPPLPGTNLPRVSAGTKESPVPAGSDDMGDLDAPTETQSAAPQAAAAQLPGQHFPTRISKGGKTLYESTGPSGRWAPMVASVFQQAAEHQDPEFAAAGKRAQQMAQKLIGVDGIAPKDAINFAADQLQNEIQQITNFRRTELGTRPKYGGGGVAVPTMKERRPFNDEMNRTLMQFKSEKLDEQFQGYNAAIGSIGSANTASQYDALNRLIQARSGLTVSDRERAIYDNLAGMWNGWMKKFNLLTGGELPDEYRTQLKTMMGEARQAVLEEKNRRAQAAAAWYRAKTRGADPNEVELDAQAVANAVLMGANPGMAAPGPGAGGDPNADLDR